MDLERELKAAEHYQAAHQIAAILARNLGVQAQELMEAIDNHEWNKVESLADHMASTCVSLAEGAYNLGPE